ncbi:MAG: hypothetical protein JNM68_14290, partial [Dinghuibacter sp.]|nr:hypothetical protein [Dinghuibacter sp.]
MRKVILLFIFFFSVLASQAQLTEGFEGGTFPPTGWLLNPAAGNTWETATNGAAGGDDAAINPFTVNPHSGTGMARFRSYDFSSGTSAELISSVINLSAGGPHVVKFWFHQDNGYASNLDSVAVYINTTQSFTGATRINKVSRPIASPAQQWNQFSFNIPASFNTSTNYIIFKAYSRFGNNMFIDDVSVESAPSCISPTVAVVPGNTTAALSWGTVTGATGYEWAVTTSATPPASGTATGATSANATGLTAVTQYYAHVRTACGASFSAWTTLQFKTSFDCSTAEVISACGVSKTASLSGTGVYNITACGFSTPGTEKLYSFTPTVSGNYTLNITAANGEWIDYFYKAASGGCGETGWTCIDDNNAVGTDVFGPLTAGVTYYILLDPEDASVTSTATFDLICPAVAPPPCTTNLTPTNGATGVSPVTLTWNAAAGATGYNVFFGTTNPPTANIGSTTATTANITGTLPGTTYYWYVQPTNTAGGATGCETSTFSFTTANAPVNDTACGAIVLTQGGPQDCKSTTTATSVGDPSLSCGTPNNTLWYRYTPATNGTVLARLEIPGASTSPLNGWLAWYTATGTCPSPPGLTLTQLGSCSEFGQTGAGDVDTLVSPVLTAGTTYYIMIDGVVGDAGDFCINLLAPPPPPPCTANITPTNGATGVTSVAGNVALTWTVSPGATSYDVYFGTTNPPTTNIGNTTSNTVNITGTSYNTTYYWYVVPRNTGGPATGCQTNTTSFTTENPTNCVPSYTTGCTLADSIIYFSLKGNSGTVIYNYSSGFCNTTAGQRGYSDYSGSGFYTPPVLSRNESYAGVIQTGDPNDYITIWIDGNDNGFFEDGERLI